jgi:hypothetical protein
VEVERAVALIVELRRRPRPVAQSGRSDHRASLREFFLGGRTHTEGGDDGHA